MKITLNKATLSRVLLPFVTAWALFMPVQAYAILPVVPVLGAAFLEGSAAAAASIAIAEAATGTSAGVLAGAASATVIDAVATGLVTTIGAAVMYLSLLDSSGNAVRVPLVPPAKSSTPIPAPSAPGTTSQETTYQMFIGPNPSAPECGSCNNGCAIQEACGYMACQSDYIARRNGATCTVGQCAFVAYVTGNDCAVNNRGSIYHYSGGAVQSCPSGYVNSGSTCILADSRAAVADNKADFSRTPSGFARPASTDKDVKTPSTSFNSLLNASTISGDGVSVSISAKNPNGVPMVYSVTARPDGGTTVTQSTQTAFANADSGVKTQTFQISPDGIIEAAAQTTTTGQISTTANASGVISTAINGTPVTQSVTSINFPNDYARQGEARTVSTPNRNVRFCAK